MAADDRIRTSDADRDHVTARLRDHFAEGRLTREELDERLATALNARTFGELRGVMADLPEPAALGAQQAWPMMPRTPAPPLVYRRRGPRILPLMALALFAAVLIPSGGWVVFVFFKVLLVLWLVACLGAVFAAARFGRRARRHWHGGHWDQQHWHHQHWHHQHWQGGYGSHESGYWRS